MIGLDFGSLVYVLSARPVGACPHRSREGHHLWAPTTRARSASAGESTPTRTPITSPVVDEHGRPLGDREFGATGAGYRKVIDYLRGFGVVVAVAVEGTGSYGAELARILRRAGMTVLEVARPDRRARRLHGKSDPLDALQAAVIALSGRGLATPKDRDGLVESMRILLTERSSAQGARRGDEPDPCSAVTAPEHIRVTYRNLGNVKLVAALSRSRPTPGHGPEQTLRGSVKRLAVAISSTRPTSMASTPGSVSWPPRSTRPYCSCPASVLSSPASFWSPVVTTPND